MTRTVSKVVPAVQSEWRNTDDCRRIIEVLYRANATQSAPFDPAQLAKLLARFTGKELELLCQTRTRFGAALPPSLPGASRTSGQPVIFLDVDGVLHPAFAVKKRARRRNSDSSSDGEEASADTQGPTFYRSCMERLKTIVHCTGASIVLTSTWRLERAGVRDVNAALQQYGLAPVADKTMDLSRGSACSGCAGLLYRVVCCGARRRQESATAEMVRLRRERVDEILAWLEGHPDTERWCVIDDLDLSLDRLRGHCVRTCPRNGIEDVHMWRAVAILLRGCAGDSNSCSRAPTPRRS